jgi:hypothetical protein
MPLEDISKYEGTHAFLSPSQPAWLRYTDTHLLDMYRQARATEMGTRLHAWAEETINLGIEQKNRTILGQYVNDALGYRMEPEKLLFHTKYCYGTADTIIFNHRKRTLRIHDLKTGVTKPHADQLKVYAALWCLSNAIEPSTITIICRFYHKVEGIIEFSPSAEEIKDIMNIILHHEKMLEQEDGGGLII